VRAREEERKGPGEPKFQGECFVKKQRLLFIVIVIFVIVIFVRLGCCLHFISLCLNLSANRLFRICTLNTHVRNTHAALQIIEKKQNPHILLHTFFCSPDCLSPAIDPLLHGAPGANNRETNHNHKSMPN